MDLIQRISLDPDLLWGTPCIRDTDITVGRVVGLVLAGWTTDAIRDVLPALEDDDVDAAIEWYQEYGESGIAPHPPEPGDRHPRIGVDPGIQGGHPTVRGTRVPVDVLVGLWERGFSVDEIVTEYPTLEPEDVEAAVDYATELWW
jgi:uncharacterized protein (DUF433 family)